MVDNLKNTELEEAVLGSVIQFNEVYTQIAEIFSVSLFTNPDYANVAKIIIRLKNEGKPVDLLTVTAQMKASDYFNDRFGIPELSRLSDRVASYSNTTYHTRILIQYQMKRQVIEVSQKTIQMAYAFDSDSFDVVDFAEKGISEITNSLITSNYSTPEELHKQAILDNERLLALNGALGGITSGFRKIDDITGGWQKGTLNIIAGATSMGKSAIVLDFLLAATLSNNPCAFFSLEVSNKKIYQRLLSKMSGMDLHKIKSGLNDSDMRSVSMATQALQRAKIFFEDVNGLTIFQFKNKARYLKRKHGITWLAIDYLQLMEGMQKGNREQEVASVSRGLKAVSKELDIPIIALSQLSRDIDKRTDKEPKLSDLRESGSLEQDADLVAFVYRPEYYGITFVEGTNESLIGKAKFFIKKHREGELGEVKLNYIGRCTKFESEDVYEQPTLNPNINFVSEKF